MSGDSEFEKLAADYLDGTLDAAGRRRLEELAGDASALSNLTDQLQTHHRLTRLGERESGSDLPDRVVRELRLEGDADRFSRNVVGRLKSDRNRFLRVAGGAVAAGIAIFFLVVVLILGEGDRPHDAVPAGAGGEVLFVTDASASGAADARIEVLLRQLGYPVLRRNFVELLPNDLDGKSLIVVSSTSTVGKVLDSNPGTVELLRRAAVPLLTWEPMLFARLGMTAGEVHKHDWAAARDHTVVLIRDASHPLAAGLSGQVRVSRQPIQLSWGRPVGDVVMVGGMSGPPDISVLFGYERGAAMGRGRAPARRVGFFSFNEAPLHLTDEGVRLFGAAVEWCAEGKAK